MERILLKHENRIAAEGSLLRKLWHRNGLQATVTTARKLELSAYYHHKYEHTQIKWQKYHIKRRHQVAPAAAGFEQISYRKDKT